MLKVSVYKLLAITLPIITFGLLGSCDTATSIFFSPQDDVKLGAQFVTEFEADPNVKILDPSKYSEAYGHIQRITNKLLDGGKVEYRNEFPWPVKIIHDDNTLNAFCVVGGYIYVYTGLIKYLDTEDQLAGVMGHEIAHADRRHTAKTLLKQYGTELLLDVALGKNAEVLKTISSSLLSLKYSRDHEREADDYSVVYLATTPYACNGTAGFFEKISAENTGIQTPVWLSTHPSPDNRVEDINKKANEVGCSKTPSGATTYDAFKKSLP